MIISISGVDCSGKSTQVQRLKEALATHGRRCSVLWFRPGYSRQLDFARALVRRARPQALPTASDPEARAQAFRKPWLRRAWIAMALGDTLMELAARARLLSLLGHTVICDRYLADAMLDLELRFPEVRLAREALLAGLRLVCPRPVRSFLLSLPREEMLRRMAEKNEPFPDDATTRDARYEAYAALATSGGFEVVDAARSIDDVHADLLSRLPYEARG